MIVIEENELREMVKGLLLESARGIKLKAMASSLDEIKGEQEKEIETSKKEQLAKYETERLEMENKRPEEFKKKKDSIEELKDLK